MKCKVFSGMIDFIIFMCYVVLKFMFNGAFMTGKTTLHLKTSKPGKDWLPLAAADAGGRFHTFQCLTTTALTCQVS